MTGPDETGPDGTGGSPVGAGEPRRSSFPMPLIMPSASPLGSINGMPGASPSFKRSRLGPWIGCLILVLIVAVGLAAWYFLL
jgi:hypothetical protein